MRPPPEVARMRSARLSVLLLLTLAACATAGPPGMGNARASAGARDGIDAWLQRGDVAAAERMFRGAREEDPADPWASMGLALLARRSLETGPEVERLLDVVRAAPDQAVALVALERLAELARLGAEVDRAIEAGLAPLAAGGRLRGIAAFRARVARIAAAESSGDLAAVVRLRQEYGVATEWTVVGPLSPLGALDFDADLGGAALPAEAPVVPGAPPAPARRIPSPNGILRLEGEEAAGIHLLASDVTLRRGGRYLLVLWTHGSARVELDGARVAERRAFAAFEPATQVFEVELPRGAHRLAVRFAPGDGGGLLTVGLARADGEPSDASWSAPAPGPLPAASPRAPRPPSPWTAPRLAEALERGAGPIAARLLAARAFLRLDREGAKRLLADAARLAPGAAPVRAALADALADDPTLDRQVARSRGEAELRRALARDPGDAEARLALSALLRGSDRAADAEAVVAELTPTVAERPLALVERAAVARARGAPERADALAAAARGSCEAREMLHDSAAARDAVAELDALARGMAGCRGGRDLLVRHLERRGEYDAALEAAAPDAAASPASIDGASKRADLKAAKGDLPGAIGELEAVAGFWPSSARIWKRLASLRELAGDRRGARAARERALAADGADLDLRRAVALEEGGEVLDALREDGEAAIRAYEAAGGARDTSTALVLDAAAQIFHPGGAVTDRTHQVIHVLDQRGVDRYGEVQLPPGAQVLTLRTRKPDGRTQAPHGDRAKGSTSLSGLEPGDYVELEYLRATRGALDGHAADPFYFQDSGERLVRSTYTVVAPAELGLEVDAHGMEAPPLERRDGQVTLRVLRTDVPGLVSEPGAPGPQEFLPAIQVGYGGGQEVLQRRMADALAPRTRATLEITALADEVRRAAGPGAGPEDLARAAWREVAGRIAGGAGSLADDASEVLSRGRGSRTLLLAALLGAMGIDARIALVRSFEQDPRPYRFPRHSLYGEVLLRIRAGGRELWVDPDQRDAPFGSLPGGALDAEALILPAPGEPLEVARTPAEPLVPSGRSTEVRIAIDERGDAVVEGIDRYVGHTAGVVRGALERFDAATRRRLFEQSVAASFRGGTLEALALRGTDDREGPLAVEWRARVPAFARPDRGGLVVEAAILPLRLSDSFVRLATRTLPLLVPQQEPLVQRVALTFPPGFVPSPAPTLVLASEWGRFERSERLEGKTLIREERVQIPRTRVQPERYPEFARFITSIDAAQGEPLRVGGDPANPGGPR